MTRKTSRMPATRSVRVRGVAAVIEAVSGAAGRLGAFMMAMAGVMLTYEVVARFFFVKPTIWAAELSQLCLIWGCLLAMPWVLSLGRHIAVDAVTDLLPAGTRLFCRGVALVAVAAFSVAVAAWGWGIFLESFARGRTTGSLLDLPSWIAELAVPAGFALLALQATAELGTLRQGGRQGPETGSE